MVRIIGGRALTTAVTKTVRSQTTGEPHPTPGISVRQATFSVRLQTFGNKGSSGVAVIPVPAGPRNRGHSWAEEGASSENMTVAIKTQKQSLDMSDLSFGLVG